MPSEHTQIIGQKLDGDQIDQRRSHPHIGDFDPLVENLEAFGADADDQRPAGFEFHGVRDNVLFHLIIRNDRDARSERMRIFSGENC